ncbi:putative ribonuclease H-like domain-containing protein, partial [Tanacetum coccineum]
MSFDDLYNNIRIFEPDVKGSKGSSSSTQNVAFVSFECTSSTNEVSTAYGVSTSSGINSQREGSSSYTDELMYSFFANQSSGPQLDHEDLEQVDEFNLEEMDLKCQVAMISMRLKKFYKKTGRKLEFDAKEPVGFDKTKVECFNCHKTGHFARECYQKGIRITEEGMQGTLDTKQETMGGDLQNRLNLMHWFMEIDLDDKTDVFIYHKKLLAKAVKEKEELKTKLEKWQNSSKGLNKLLNSQMSAKDKTRLGYRDQIHGMNNENDVLESVFESRSRDTDDSPVYDRFAKFKGMHAVPPLMIGNFMPPKSDFGIDESKFTYGPNQFKTSKSDAKTSDFDSCEANSSIETLESVPKPVINEPKVVSEPRVWSDAPIIEEYESDSDNEYVITPSKEQKKPSYAFVNTVEHVKTPRETVKEQNTYSQSPKVDQRNWNGLKYKTPSLGYGLTRKACFVCGSLGHLIRDYDFLKKRMAKQVELNKKTGKGTGHREISVVGGNRETAVKASAGYNWRSKRHYWERVSKYNSGSMTSKSVDVKDPQGRLNFKQRNENRLDIVDVRRHMIWKQTYIVEYQDYNGGGEGKITGKGRIRTKKLDFEDVYFVKELKHFNLFSVSQMCDKKNKVLFTDTECIVLSPNFKLPDENQVLLRVPRQNNMYSFNLENIAPSRGKFDGKSNERFLVGYSLNSKAFRVYNLETKRVEENLHINFLENKPNVAGKGPTWLFDLDYLTNSMNYQPVSTENQANKTACLKEADTNAGTKDDIDAGNSEREAEPVEEYFVLPLWSSYTSTVKSSEAKNGGEKPQGNTGSKDNDEPVNQEDQAFLEELARLKRQETEADDNAAEAHRNELAQGTEDLLIQAGVARASSTNTNANQDDSQIAQLEDIYENPSDGIFTNASYDDEGAVAAFINPESTMIVIPIPTSRVYSIHLNAQIIGDPKSAVQTRRKVNNRSGAHAFLKIKVWILVDLPFGKKVIGTKWVYRNKKDERGVVVRNKARLVAQGHRQEEGIDCDEVFAPVARIEAIGIFLAFASFMGFIVYQMDVKSDFLYGTIDEDVYVSQPPGFVAPQFPNKVYKVVKALYGLHQAPRAWYATLSTFLVQNGYRRGIIDKTLFIKKEKNDIMLVQVYVDDIIFGSTKKASKKEDRIFISQDKYVAEILKKFDFTSVKTTSTPIETQKPLVKDEEADDVDVHHYRSMIGSLMYLTASRPDN